MESFFTFEFDGDIFFPFEQYTKEAAMNVADNWYAETYLDTSQFNHGDSRSDMAFIVEYYYDDDDNEIVIDKEKYVLYFEAYHGDFTGHTVWRKGGVL